MGGGLGYLAGAEVSEGDRLRTTQYELMGLRAKVRGLETILAAERVQNRTLRTDVFEERRRSKAYKETLEDFTAEMADLKQAFEMVMWKPRKHDDFVASIRNQHYHSHEHPRRMRTVKAWVNRNAGPYDDVVDGRIEADGDSGLEPDSIEPKPESESASVDTKPGSVGSIVAEGEPKPESVGSIVAEGEPKPEKYQIVENRNAH